MRLIVEAGADCCRKNLPTTNEVAVIIPYEFDDASSWDILLAVCDPARGQLTLEKVPVTNAVYMLLHYILFFLRGDYGWHYRLTLQTQTRKKTQLE
jgi:hypothetical protein